MHSRHHMQYCTAHQQIPVMRPCEVGKVSQLKSDDLRHLFKCRGMQRQRQKARQLIQEAQQSVPLGVYRWKRGLALAVYSHCQALSLDQDPHKVCFSSSLRPARSVEPGVPTRCSVRERKSGRLRKLPRPAQATDQDVIATRVTAADLRENDRPRYR